MPPEAAGCAAAEGDGELALAFAGVGADKLPATTAAAVGAAAEPGSLIAPNLMLGAGRAAPLGMAPAMDDFLECCPPLWRVPFATADGWDLEPFTGTDCEAVRAC